MALWKPFRGNRADLDAIEKHDGYVYFCTDDGALFFDYTDADGNLQRKQISAKDAETLTGYTFDQIIEAAKATASAQDVVVLAEAQAYTEEYVDNAIAGITDWTTGADEDISNLLERTEAIETDVETIKQGYVTVGYVNEKTQNIPAIKEDIETLKTDAETFKEYFEVINTSYATKKYVDDAVASSGGGTGGGVSSWNDLTDKPFYDEGTKTATLDYANPPTVGIDFNGVFLGKVTDDILTADYINGAKLSLSFTVDDTVTDVSQELNTDTLMGFSFSFGSAYQFTDENITCMIAVATQSGEFDLFGDGNLINIPETGTYIDCSFISGEGTINSISLEYAGELKTLDIKFIPQELLTTIDQRIENYINEALGGDY